MIEKEIIHSTIIEILNLFLINSELDYRIGLNFLGKELSYIDFIILNFSSSVPVQIILPEEINLYFYFSSGKVNDLVSKIKYDEESNSWLMKIEGSDKHILKLKDINGAYYYHYIDKSRSRSRSSIPNILLPPIIKMLK
jgi:hypothetical protein